MNDVLARNGPLTVVRSPRGWGVLDPMPDPEDVVRYYGEDDAEYDNQEGNEWLFKELKEHQAGLWNPAYRWQSSMAMARSARKFRRWGAVDVGAGAGWFLDWWNSHHYFGFGVEPSRTAREFSHVPHSLLASKQEWEGRLWDSICPPPTFVRFSLVLEHVPDPAGFLREHLAWRDLDVRRVLVVVPNEFNPLQRAVLRRDPIGTFRDVPLDPVHHHRRAWFVDRRHLNYFDPEGLRACFREAGLRVIREAATFPMELFILAGMDYRKDPALGAGAHIFRLKFERALGGLAFRLYKVLYDRWGIGRELIFIGEPT